MNYNKKTAAYLAAFSMAITMLFSCEKPIISDDADNNDGTKSITFNLYTPAVTRAASVADFQTVLVLDIMDGKTVQLVKQERGTSGFGAPTLELTPGLHTLRFMATDCPVADMTISNDYTDIYQRPLGDTFYKSIDIDARTAETSQNVVLERIIAHVVYKAPDPSVVFGRLYHFNLVEGHPVYEDQQETSMSENMNIYTYIPQNGLLTLDNGITVPVAKNRRTVIYDREGTTDYDPNPGDEDEIKVLENDTAIFYCAKREIQNVRLTDTPNPSVTYAQQLLPYRIPTRLEAVVLRAVTLPDGYWSGARSLAYDRPEDNIKVGSTEYGTGNFYTFLWGSGSVSAASQTTKYCIKPIRTTPLAPIYIPFSITADFTWSTDSIKMQ